MLKKTITYQQKQNEELLFAAITNDIRGVRKALENGADFFAIDPLSKKTAYELMSHHDPIFAGILMMEIRSKAEESLLNT